MGRSKDAGLPRGEPFRHEQLRERLAQVRDLRPGVHQDVRVHGGPAHEVLVVALGR